jgi:predicted small metal-binding protein
MKKVIYCREVGFDCDGKVSAETEEEVVAKAAKHAMEVHGVKEITPEIAAQVKSVVRDEP